MKRLSLWVLLALAALTLGLCVAAFGQDLGPISGGEGGGGTVTSFTFTDNAEFDGTVTNAGTTPTLVLALQPNSITAAKFHFAADARLLGRVGPGAGVGSEVSVSTVLDWLGSHPTGTILYRSGLGWTTFTPSTGYLRWDGVNMEWRAEDNEKTANKGANGGYAPLNGSGIVPDTNLPPYESQDNKNIANGYVGLNGSSLVDPQFLGTGGVGGGAKFLTDNNTYVAVSGSAGGTVTEIGLTMPSQFTTTPSGTNPETSAGTFAVAWNAQSAYSWFGNATGSSAQPVFNTSVFPAQLMPAHTGDVNSSAGSVALTIGNDAVTYAKMQEVTANSLIGNATGSTANPTAITVEAGQFASSTLKFYAATATLSGTSPTADAAITKSFKITLSGVTTCTFTHLGDGDSAIVTAKQAAAGGPYTITFASSGDTFIWQGGSQPTQTATANKRDAYQFHKQGTEILANAIQNF